MRPVDKGTAPCTYSKYTDAKRDLINQNGPYCSYCEMPIRDLGYVDHVHPLAKGGNELDWDNLLLSCFFCNLTKSNDNDSRIGYLWPDRDNTDLAYEYHENFIIRPTAHLTPEQYQSAQSLIDLTGIDRTSINSTKKDRRWRNRSEAWKKAEAMYKAWQKNNNRPGLMVAIPHLAAMTGYYSIWMTVFANEPQLLASIKSRFPNIYTDTDANGDRIIRANGIL